MKRCVALLCVAFALAACAPGPAGPGPSLPAIRTQVFQNGRHPLQWTRFTPNDAGTYHQGMVTGPDGALWFTDSERGLFRIDMRGNASIYQFRSGFSPGFITLGADKKLYVVEQAGLSLEVFQPPARVKFYSLDDETQDSSPGLGPDGNVWVTGLQHVIRITPHGQISYYAYPSHDESNIFSGIAAGSDGNVWFTEIEPSYQVAKIDPKTFKITEYPFPCQPQGIAPGGDGNLYVGCPGGVVRVTTSGKTTPITYGAGTETSPGSIVEGPDGDIYFGTFQDAPIVGHLHVKTGTIDTLSIPYHGYGVAAQAPGPDGNIWDVDGQGYVNVYIRNVLDVTPKTVKLNPGSQATLTASYSGSGTLNAVSHNTKVATVKAGLKRDTFAVQGVSTGLTTIVISDGMRNTFAVSVTVQ